MSETSAIIEKINLALIDEPENPMRSDSFDDEIKELAESIKSYGLIQPITLKKNGERYEVVAGHRRFLAHRYLGLAFIESIIKDVDAKTSDIIKVEENLRRRDINPVDEANFINGFLERNNLSAKEVAELLNRSDQFIQSRLDLLTYPDYLLASVKEGKISLGAAQHLALIEPDYLRRDYCRIAAIRGLSITMAKDWLNQAKFSRLPTNPEEYQPSAPALGGDPEYSKYKCLYCHEVDEVINLFNGWYHENCKQGFDSAFKETSGPVEPEVKD